MSKNISVSQDKLKTIYAESLMKIIKGSQNVSGELGKMKAVEEILSAKGFEVFINVDFVKPTKAEEF